MTNYETRKKYKESGIGLEMDLIIGHLVKQIIKVDFFHPLISSVESVTRLPVQIKLKSSVF